jgi:hypothetical protein
MTTSEFLSKMQGFADDLIAAGHPLTDRQLVSYILAGLGADYNALVAALGVATTPITLSLLFSHLHAYDQRQLMLNGPSPPEFETSANAAARQWRPRSGNNNFARNRGDHGDRGDRSDRADRGDRGERRDFRLMTVPSIRAVGAVVDPLEAGEAVAAGAAARPRGWMLPARYAIKKVIPQKIAGLATLKMMTMVTKKFTLLMGSTLIGIKIRVPLIILQASSTI